MWLQRSKTTHGEILLTSPNKSKFLSVIAFPITFVFLTNLPLSFCQTDKLFEASRNFFWPCGYKEAKLRMVKYCLQVQIIYLQPSVSIFLGIDRRQNFEIQCRYGEKSDITTSTEMIGWVWDIH